MLVQAYFDESHQHSEAMPASAVSAVVGSGLQWAQFTELWLGVLQHYGVTDKKGRHVFHTSEFESPEGRIGTVYEHWSKEKRESFQRDLLHAIRFSGIRCFAAAVIADEYKEVASKRSVVVLPDETFESDRASLFGNKYFFCAYWAMTYAADEAKLYYPKSTRVAYYFESCSGSDKYKQPIDLLYDMAVKDTASQDEYFRFYCTPHFGPKDSAVPLQAADKIAYECAKEVSHICDLNPPERYSEVREGRVQWKQRFAALYLNALGAEIHLRYWRKEHLELFFQMGEERTALPASELKD